MLVLTYAFPICLMTSIAHAGCQPVTAADGYAMSHHCLEVLMITGVRIQPVAVRYILSLMSGV